MRVAAHAKRENRFDTLSSSRKFPTFSAMKDSKTLLLILNKLHSSEWCHKIKYNFQKFILSYIFFIKNK